MIDIIRERLVQGDLDEKIIKWTVRWKTPLGIYNSLAEAVKGMQENNIDPIVCIVPIAVAITNSTNEAWIR